MKRIRRLLYCCTLVLVVGAAGCSFQAGNQQAPVKPEITSKTVPKQEQTPAVPKQESTPALPKQEPASAVSPSAKESAIPAVFPNIAVDHIVIVVEENHKYNQIVGNTKAPYMQSLIERGALFTNAYAIAHPSQPNYFALFSGSTQNITDDSCKGPFTAANLATELLKNKLTFAGYSEDLPHTGFTGCTSNGYGRKHNPWAQFTNVPKEANKPFSDFPQDFTKLPTVSFVIPNMKNDMHDGTIEQADAWLKNHLDAYVSWSEQNRSLLILTWDEDDFAKENKIPLIMVGPMIKPGTYHDKVNHYHVLRTIEDLYGLEPLANSRGVQPIKTIWK